MKYHLGPWIFNAALNVWSAPAGTVGLLDLRSRSGIGGANYGFFVVPDAVTLGADYVLLGQGHIAEVIPNAVQKSALSTLLNLPGGFLGTTLLDGVWNAVTTQADPTGVDRVRPLVPTVAGNIELHLSGHSLVRGKRFALDIPEAAPVIAQLKEHYRRIRADVQAGTLGNGDPEFHRRVLDYWGEKYRVTNPEDIFIPNGVPKEKRLKHATTITDNFNRADADALGTSSEGWSWTELVGDIDIVSNQAKSATVDSETVARAETDLSGDDHYTQAVVSQDNVSSAAPGMLTRFSATAQDFYIGLANQITAGYSIFRCDAGSYTQLDTLNEGLSFPGTLKMESDGSNHRLYFNGASKLGPVSDPSGHTGFTRVGVRGMQTVTGGVIWDDFEAADLAVGGGALFRPAGKRFTYAGNGGGLVA